MKELLRQLCPPLVWHGLQNVKSSVLAASRVAGRGSSQDLDVYWDPRMAEILEHWGEGNAWNEIQLLLASCRGRTLDIACGTGKTMSLLARFPALEVYGCDISDMLIDKAVQRGIPPGRLTVMDATAMSYPDGAFEWGYSIGSLEHFTEDGVGRLLRECSRVVSGVTFHMVPVSRSGRDEGWIKTSQSYHNNSVRWWESRCHQVYPAVQVLDSSWADQISLGKWLMCQKQP